MTFTMASSAAQTIVTIAFGSLATTIGIATLIYSDIAFRDRRRRQRRRQEDGMILSTNDSG